MIYLSNGIISAEISEIGAELKSLKKNGYEYMWYADPQIWGSSAPVLFPILCALKNDRYILDGKSYQMPKHGFVRSEKFSVENVSDTSVTLLYTDNEKTLEVYPFKFEFRVIFALKGSSVEIEYKVNNINDREMYFSVGAHEAFATPEGIEDYDLIFPYKEDFETVLLNGGLLQKHTMTVAKNTEYLPLYDKYFVLDTLIFKNLRSREVILKNRKTERAVKVEFPNCDYIAFWHKHSAPYLCIEPWSGLPDNDDTDHNIKTKEGILTLEARGEYSNIHTITV